MENDSVEFVKGDIVKVVNTPCVGTHEQIFVDCPELFKDVKVGNSLLINDGKLRLNILSINLDKTELTCEVYNSGPIATKKSVNVPGVVLSMPFISEKDDADIRFGAQHDVDFIAASFVRRASDVMAIRMILAEEGHPEIEIIAKIENQEGYDNLDAILNVADAVMVARGDLGVEVSLDLVPLYQKHIISTANRVGKPVITATHMLESMTGNPRPTRAEASDVANAVFDGTDCVMTSAETASGEYPVEAVATMANITEQCEREYDYNAYLDKQVVATNRTMSDAIGISVAESCLSMQSISAIVALTESGGTAKRLSKFKPDAPIIACTNSLSTCRRMSLYSDVYPIYNEDILNPLTYDKTAQEAAKQFKLPKGSTFIICSGWNVGHGNTNTMRFSEVGNEE